MEGITYRIKLASGSEVFEVEGDREFVLEMLAKHYRKSGGQAQQLQVPTVSASPRLPSVGVEGKSLSAGEFIRKLGYSKHTDMVLGFAYYLEKYCDAKDFSAPDINALYYEAKLESSNTSQMIIQNVRKSYYGEH